MWVCQVLLKINSSSLTNGNYILLKWKIKLTFRYLQFLFTLSQLARISERSVALARGVERRRRGYGAVEEEDDEEEEERPEGQEEDDDIEEETEELFGEDEAAENRGLGDGEDGQSFLYQWWRKHFHSRVTGGGILFKGGTL